MYVIDVDAYILVITFAITEAVIESERAVKLCCTVSGEHIRNSCKREGKCLVFGGKITLHSVSVTIVSVVIPSSGLVNSEVHNAGFLCLSAECYCKCLSCICGICPNALECRNT